MKRLLPVAAAVAAFAAGAPAPIFQAEAQTDSIYLCQEHEGTFRDSRTNGISEDALRELELATRTRCPNLNARVNARLRDPVRNVSQPQRSAPTPNTGDLCRTHRSLWPLMQETGTAAQVQAFREQVPSDCAALRTEVEEFQVALRRGGPRPQGARPALTATTGTGPLRVDQSRTGELTTQEARPDGRVWDDYQLTLEAAQSVELRLISDAFDAYLEVGTGSGESFQPVASNDDDGQTLNSLVRYQALSAGTLTVRARALGGRGTGAYRIEARAVELTPPPAPRRIAFGQSRAGVLIDGEARAFDDRNQLYDLYSFEARGGQRVQLSMDAAVGANGRLAFDTMLVVGRIRDGVFQRLASNDDMSSDSTNARLRLLIPEDGEYLVRAQAYSSGGAGEYEIRFEQQPERPAPSPVALPERPNAVIYQSALTDDMPVVRNETHYQDFALRARQGRQYIIELASPAFEPYLEVGETGAGGFTALATSDEPGSAPNSARLRFNAPRNGVFVVRARSYSEGVTGAFEVTILEAGATQ